VFVFLLGICEGKKSQYKRDPTDCGKYVRCVGSTPFFHVCPPGLYFDLTQNVCNWKRLVDCSNGGGM